MQQVGTRLWAHHAGDVQRAAGRFDDTARWCCAGCKNDTIGVKTKNDEFKWKSNADGMSTPSEPRSGPQAGACRVWLDLHDCLCRLRYNRNRDALGVERSEMEVYMRDAHGRPFETVRYDAAKIQMQNDDV
jgi:hypothetical protein